MAGAEIKPSQGSIRLGILIAVAVALALAGAVVAIAAIIPIHPGGAVRSFSAFGCDFDVQFDGTVLDDKDTPDPSDDEYIWSYTVTEQNGDPGCGLSHWVLELCQPEAFGAYIDSEPAPSFQVIDDPGTTGLTGVKWNDIQDAFVSGTFTVTLSQNFALDPNVPVGFKTGAGVVTGDIEGPACVVDETGTIAVCKEVVPSDASLWDFTLTGPTPGNRSGLGDGQCHFFNDRDPGSYTLMETMQVGYNTFADCGPKGSSSDNSITFGLDPGQNVTCIFTNVASVGGIAELPTLTGVAVSESASSGPSPGTYAVLAAVLALTALTLSAGGRYAWRRWLR